jgi:Domain of unknown function (DUF4277)
MMNITIQVIIGSDSGTPELVQDVAHLQREELLPETLGLSLAEANALLASVQRAMVTEQIAQYHVQHTTCERYGKPYSRKDTRPIVYRTVFGTLQLPNVRLLHCPCQPHPTRTFSPLADLLPERTAPECLYLEAKSASLMSYGLTIKLLEEVLPLDSLNTTFVRHHLQAVAQRCEDELGDEQAMFIEGCERDWEELPRPDLPLTVGIDGGYVHSCEQTTRREGWFEADFPHLSPPGEACVVWAWWYGQSSSPAEEMVRPDHPSSRRPVVDHLGLVAGMVDALGLGDVLDHATHHHPELRALTVGEAVNARVRHGFGVSTQALSLVPRLFPQQPTSRLVSPRMAPEPLNDDALGRAGETLDASGVTARYRRMAATAAARLGLAPRFGQLDRTRVHVDGRDHSDDEPAAQGVPSTRGDSRAHRPDRHHVLVELTVAGEADARQALSTFAPALPPIALAASTVRAQLRDAPRGRPRSEARPDQVVYPIDGALASALTVRQALIDPHGCVILATKALDTAHRPPHERLAGDKGQVHGARGCRCWQDPQCFASSLDLNTPERIMALRMVMPVCVLVDAALAYRSRHARNAPAATCPDQRGTRLQQPTARWVFHAWGGIHWRCQAGQWPIVLNLTTAHQHWLRLLGQPSLARYDVQ